MTLGPKWTVMEGTYRYQPLGTKDVLIHLESAGNDDYNKANYRAMNIDLYGTNALSATVGRSYRISRLYLSAGVWNFDYSKNFDVFGSSASAVALDNYLQGFQPGDLLILNTYDEPDTNRTNFRNTLINKFGATKLYSGWEYRGSYQLISICDYGPVYEQVIPRYRNGIQTTVYLGK